MNNTYAIISSGVVVNLIIWDGDTVTWNPPDGMSAVLIPNGAFVDIGYLYDSNGFRAN